MDHYFSTEPSSKLIRREIEVVAREVHLHCTTGSGTFSAKHLDKGTQALIEIAILREQWRVLDLGCGWGAVGLIAAKLGCTVVMTDINTRATKLARENARRNNLKVKVVQGDLYEKVDGFFDCILLNPPQTAGRKLCYEMIEQAPNYLTTSGVFQLVARHKKGGAMLQKKMEEIFGNVQILGKQSGFTVYLSKKTDKSL